jgi:histidyl-tRNA synthetase
MTYAAKIADHACIIGEDEIKSREIGLKDLATGNIETIKIPEF